MRRLTRILLAGTSPLALAVLSSTAWAGWMAAETVSQDGTTYTSSADVIGPTATNGQDGDAAGPQGQDRDGFGGENSAGLHVTGHNSQVNITGGLVDGGRGGDGGAGAPGYNGGHGGGSSGIFVQGNNVSVTVGQAARITGGIAGSGGAAGSGGQTGDGSAAIGIYVSGQSVNITNDGTISGGTPGGNQMPGEEHDGIDGGISLGNKSIRTAINGTIINNGTINGGIDYYTIGNTITNNGVINGWISGDERSSATIVNNGIIHANGAGEGHIGIDFYSVTEDASFTNNGTVNGDINVGVLANSHHAIYLNKGSVLNGNVEVRTAGNGTVTLGQSGSGTVRLNGELGSAGDPLHQISIVNDTTLELAGNSELHYNWLNVSGDTVYDFKTHRMGITYYATGQGPTDIINGPIAFKTTIDANARKHGYIVFASGNNSGGDHDNIEQLPTITPTVVGTVAPGSRYVIIQDTLGRTADVLPAVVNGGGYRWTVSQETGTGQTDSHGVSFGSGYTNFVITADRLNAAGVAGAAGGLNGAGIGALVSYAGSNPSLQALSQAVNNLTDAAEIRRAGAQLRPETTGNTAQASLGAVSSALSTVQVRSDAVRVASAGVGTGESGVSSGEVLRGLGVWGQGFGSTATQRERKGVSGYDADTYGLAFGVDAKLADPLRAGVSFAYARTGVDASGDRSGSGQDIDSYITSLYGTYTGTGWYVDGALTYGLHAYDGRRRLSIAGAPAQTLTAEYTGQQWGAKAEAGVPLAFGSVVVTPLASLAYNTLKQEDYSETGGAAALRVGSSSTDSIRSGLGGKVSARVATFGNWEVIPNARAVWHHEFNGSAPDQTSGFVAGGASFTTPGSDIAADHLTLGLGLDLASVRNTTLSAKYDADIADRYLSHSASLQLRTEF